MDWTVSSSKRATSRLSVIIISLVILVGCGREQTRWHVDSLNDIEKLQAYFREGGDREIRDENGETLLHRACIKGNYPAAELLVNNGADVNAMNGSGSTPLHLAAFFGRERIVKLLLLKGVDLQIRNSDNVTAIQLVSTPWENVEPVYQKFQKIMKSRKISIDLDRIRNKRPEIARMIKESYSR